MLEYIISSKTKRELLKLFMTKPDRSFYVREISRLIIEPVNAVNRELRYLEKAGLISFEKRGNQKHYSVIKESPLYPDLKRLIYTTVGLGDYLREKFAEPEQIELAFVYGSVANNSEIAKSDIDLFMVGEIDENKLHKVISQIEKDLNRTVNYTLMSEKEFTERCKKKEAFINRVLSRPKIVLKGRISVD